MADDRDEAFAAALKGLFRQYRRPAEIDKRVFSQREYTVSLALRGRLRAGYLLLPTQRAYECKIPVDQLIAIHTLIYPER